MLSHIGRRAGGATKKSALVVLMAMGFVTSQGAALAAQQEPPVAQVTGGDDLVEEKGPFQGTWIHPDANINRFDKIYMWDAVFQFRDVAKRRNEGTTRGRMHAESNQEWPIADESRKRFEEVFTETFVKELQNSSKFEVVDKVGPGTLIVRGAVLDIVSNVPATARRSTVFLWSLGQGTDVRLRDDRRRDRVDAGPRGRTPENPG